MENSITQNQRYSDTDLEEFKQVILTKLSMAREELTALSASLQYSNPNGTDDTAGTYATLEDGSATMDKEHLHQLAGRQQKFIQQLEAALIRVANKTYGICRTTGTLIQKERLLAVPHTTQSMAAKLAQN